MRCEADCLSYSAWKSSELTAAWTGYDVYGFEGSCLDSCFAAATGTVEV
jgi:hypothetical protein